MRIGIVNTGNIGRELARSWATAGHELVLAKDGSQDKLEALLEELGPPARKGTQREAAEFGDVVLFSVYWPRFEETARELAESLEGKLVIDTMNPLNVNEAFEHYHDLAFMQSSSTTEALQAAIPTARVAKAFSTMPAPLLSPEAWRGQPVKVPIFVVGDPDAKNAARTLANDAGFDVLDAGGIEQARLLEQLGVLLHHVGENTFDGDYTKLAPAFVRAA